MEFLSDPTAFLEKALETKEYVPERDFLVYPRWGKVPMLIEDAEGKRSARAAAPHAQDDATALRACPHHLFQQGGLKWIAAGRW